jgi:hypothetical protein
MALIAKITIRRKSGLVPVGDRFTMSGRTAAPVEADALANGISGITLKRASQGEVIKRKDRFDGECQRKARGLDMTNNRCQTSFGREKVRRG